MKKAIALMFISILVLSCSSPEEQLISLFKNDPDAFVSTATEYNDLFNQIDFSNLNKSKKDLILQILMSRNIYAIRALFNSSFDYSIEFEDGRDIADIALDTKLPLIIELYLKNAQTEKPGMFLYEKGFPLSFKINTYTVLDYLVADENIELLASLVENGTQLKVNQHVFLNLQKRETLELIEESGVDWHTKYRPSFDAALNSKALYSYYQDRLTFDIDNYLEAWKYLNQTLSFLYEDPGRTLSQNMIPGKLHQFQQQIVRESNISAFLDYSIPLDFEVKDRAAIEVLIELDGGIDALSGYLLNEPSVMKKLLQLPDEYGFSKELFLQLPYTELDYILLEDEGVKLIYAFDFTQDDLKAHRALGDYISTVYGDEFNARLLVNAFEDDMQNSGLEMENMQFVGAAKKNSDTPEAVIAYIYSLEKRKAERLFFDLIGDSVYIIPDHLPYYSEDGIAFQDILFMFMEAGYLANRPNYKYADGPVSSSFLGQWPVQIAFKHDDFQGVHKMLDYGAVPRIADLYFAFEKKQSELASEIIKAGVGINDALTYSAHAGSGQNSTRKTLVHQFLIKGNIEVISMLIDAGADLDIQYIHESEEDFTSIKQLNATALALLKGNQEAYELLIQNGAEDADGYYQYARSVYERVRNGEFSGISMADLESGMPPTEVLEDHLERLSCFEHRLYAKGGSLYVDEKRYNYIYYVDNISIDEKDKAFLDLLDPARKAYNAQYEENTYTLEEYEKRGSHSTSPWDPQFIR